MKTAKYASYIIAGLIAFVGFLNWNNANPHNVIQQAVVALWWIQYLLAAILFMLCGIACQLAEGPSEKREGKKSLFDLFAGLPSPPPDNRVPTPAPPPTTAAPANREPAPFPLPVKIEDPANKSDSQRADEESKG